MKVKTITNLRKTYTLNAQTFKLDTDQPGSFEAIFATLTAIDRDGDSYDPGAIGRQKVFVSVWNHGSWGEGSEAIPVGFGETFERENKALIQGEFDLDDADGVKHYNKLKYFLSKGMNIEWSFALPEADFRFEERDGRQVRVFTRILVPEVSPVLMGAGVDTELVSIKAGGPMEQKNSGSPPKFLDRLDTAVDAAESVARSAAKIFKSRAEAGERVAGKTRRRLEVLSKALHDVVESVDGILGIEDADKELAAIAAELEAAE